MSFTLHPELEARLRARAAAQGTTVEEYIDRLLSADQQAENELEALALEGVGSGEPMEIGTGYWEEKHRRLDQRLKETNSR